MKTELQEMLDNCLLELDDIETKLNSLPSLDITKRYLTQYALIKACGTVEFVYRSIVADYFSKFSISQIDNYLEKTVRNGSMSATYSNMNALLEKFDSSWAGLFKKNVQARIDKEKIITASNSLVNNRHSFAHGRSPSATFQEIKQYYQDILLLLYEFDIVVC